jgi:hypothetical protein
MKFGIEFEFLSKLTKMELLEEWKNNGNLPKCATYKEADYWQIGTDGSMKASGDYSIGIEVRSPILRELDSIVPVVKFLIEYSRINDTCGMHIHVSLDKDTIIADSVLEDDKYLILRDRAFRRRRKWAAETLYLQEHYRYIRRVEFPNHLEFRVFNMSWNLHYIYSCFKKVRSVMNELEERSKIPF